MGSEPVCSPEPRAKAPSSLKGRPLQRTPLGASAWSPAPRRASLTPESDAVWPERPNEPARTPSPPAVAAGDWEPPPERPPRSQSAPEALPQSRSPGPYGPGEALHFDAVQFGAKGERRVVIGRPQRGAGAGAAARAPKEPRSPPVPESPSALPEAVPEKPQSRGSTPSTPSHLTPLSTPRKPPMQVPGQFGSGSGVWTEVDGLWEGGPGGQ